MRRAIVNADRLKWERARHGLEARVTGKGLIPNCHPSEAKDLLLEHVPQQVLQFAQDMTSCCRHLVIIAQEQNF